MRALSLKRRPLSRGLFGGGAAAARPKSFDLLILGGGSGGLALSREASRLGKSVAVLDYVMPSPQGTKWGPGGTCVNVGCIPKKLMHHAALLGEAAEDAPHFGWTQEPAHEGKRPHSWPVLSENVQNYVRSLNFGYRKRLRDDGVHYINAYGRFAGPNAIEATSGNGKKEILEAEHIAVAVGTRPRLPDTPGKEHIITSDDLFWRTTSPGKTLVIGAGYVALECAGFLSGLGYDVTVAARSVYLRGFDQDIANQIVDSMADKGTNFTDGAELECVEKLASGRLLATLTVRGVDGRTSTVKDEYDTVLAATGREALTPSLCLDKAGVKVHERSGKILTDEADRTSAPNVYAIGDVAHSRPELTPVAILAGRLLGKRLFAPPHLRASMPLMDYGLVPTTVFTPLEYSCVGLSEEAARDKLGDDGLEVYHSYFTPLEWSLGPATASKGACYCKVLVDIREGGSGGDPRQQRVVGLHFLGPHAGEVMQGYAVAMRRGLSRFELEHTCGIHPTSAEELLHMDITKRSGKDPKKTGC